MSRTLRGMLAAIGMMAGGMALADTGFYLDAGYGIARVDGTAATSGSPVFSTDDEIEALPLDGTSFDDEEVAWSGFLDGQAYAYVAFGAGFTEFGTFTSQDSGFNGAEAATIDVDGIYGTRACDQRLS